MAKIRNTSSEKFKLILKMQKSACLLQCPALTAEPFSTSFVTEIIFYIKGEHKPFIFLKIILEVVK